MYNLSIDFKHVDVIVEATHWSRLPILSDRVWNKVINPPSQKLVIKQRAKKVVSDSPGLVDFAFGLVNSVLNLSDGQANFLEKFKLQKDGNQSC